MEVIISAEISGIFKKILSAHPIVNFNKKKRKTFKIGG
jgi:hypothetical protein